MMMILVILAICVSSCFADYDGCTASCNGGLRNNSGVFELCNTNPCPADCDKCAWTNGVGYLPDFDDCNCYYQCVPVKADHHGHYSWKVVHQCCPNCLDWDPTVCACNYPCMDSCCSGSIYLYSDDNGVTRSNRFNGDANGALSDGDVFKVATTKGASWTITFAGGATQEIPQATLEVIATPAAVTNLTKVYKYEVGPWEDWTTWSECYAWCDWDSKAHGGQQYERRGRHVVNWFDRDCPCEERNRSCNASGFVCPTHFTRDPCPVVFWMDFDNNLLDRFGSKVLQAKGVLGFAADVATTHCEDDSMSGEFAGDLLHVPFFSNWFSYPNNQAFTLSFWYKTASDSEGVLFSNGCEDPNGVMQKASVKVSVAAGQLHAELGLVDGPPGCQCDLDYNGGIWQFAALFYNGNTLTLDGGDNGCDGPPHACVDECQGAIGNNKCALFIGSSNTKSANSYEGLLDEVKVYAMGQDTAIPCCACP